MGWYGPQTGDCNCCEYAVCGCSSTPSDSYSVALQNWTDDGCCQDCNEFCGTHVLAKVSDCVWRKTSATGSPCECVEDGTPRYTDAYLIEMTMANVLGNLKIEITVYYSYSSGLGGYVTLITYSKTFVGNPDCTIFTNESIAYAVSSSLAFDSCDYGITPNAALLTAL